VTELMVIKKDKSSYDKMKAEYTFSEGSNKNITSRNSDHYTYLLII
jgi:hypothetical protein